MAGEKKREHIVISLWALLARNSIYKAAAALLAMTAAEIVLFYRCLGSGHAASLREMMQGSHISAVFLAALGLLVLILAWTEGRMDQQSSSFLLRLQLSDRSIFLWKAVYNVFCIVLLFAVQIWLCIYLVGLYGEKAPEAYASPQRLFLAFYREEFLHCLLPMAEVGKWVRNVLLALALGTEAAWGPEKKKNVSLVFLYALTAVWFVSPLGGEATDAICCLAYGIVVVSNVWRVWKRGGAQ